MLDLNEELKKLKTGISQLRSFSYVMGSAFFLLALLFFWRGRIYFWLPLVLAIFLLVLGWFSPTRLAGIYRAWMMLAFALGWIMTRVILVLFFFLVVTPIAFLARLTGKQFLDLRWRVNVTSYWKERAVKKIEKTSFERQY